MNREELKNLGLSDEQIDQVMANHGKATQKLRDANSKLEQQLSDVTAGNSEQGTKLEDANKQIKALTKKANQVDDLTKQLNEANGKLTQAHSTRRLKANCLRPRCAT
nr:hypothetical protein [Lacticaseibacillus sharpeae]